MNRENGAKFDEAMGELIKMDSKIFIKLKVIKIASSIKKNAMRKFKFSMEALNLKAGALIEFKDKFYHFCENCDYTLHSNHLHKYEEDHHEVTTPDLFFPKNM